MNKSLGLIETEGLAAGIEAADAAVKSANVELIGYELTKGGGWTTVKIQGDVGAVKAAVDAAKMAAAKVNRVVSTRVIPRPSAGLDMLVHNPDTVGDSSEKPDAPKPPTPPDNLKKAKEKEDAKPEGTEMSAEEMKPVKGAEPAKAETSAEEVKPVKDVKPAEEAFAEDAKPAKPETAAEDAKPAEPETAAEEVKPAEAEMPAEDAKPAEAEMPVEEEKPAKPEAPVEEVKPAEAEMAAEETKPAEESDPAEPDEKPAAPKGRRGGKRNNKRETTE